VSHTVLPGPLLHWGGQWSISDGRPGPIDDTTHYELTWMPGEHRQGFLVSLVSRAGEVDPHKILAGDIIYAADALVERVYEQDREQFWKDWFNRRTPEELVKLDTWMAENELPELPWGYCSLEFDPKYPEIATPGISIVPTFRVDPWLVGEYGATRSGKGMTVHNRPPITPYIDAEVLFLPRDYASLVSFQSPRAQFVRWELPRWRWDTNLQWANEPDECPALNPGAPPWRGRMDILCEMRKRHRSQLSWQGMGLI
jgi:hypothetical protein